MQIVKLTAFTKHVWLVCSFKFAFLFIIFSTTQLKNMKCLVELN